MSRNVVVIVLVMLGLAGLFLALRPDSTSPEDDAPTGTFADEHRSVSMTSLSKVGS
ncbi:MAG TPA: hypothetical protein VF558_11750 [Rubrobacteraceae bacterium]